MPTLISIFASPMFLRQGMFVPFIRIIRRVISAMFLSAALTAGAVCFAQTALPDDVTDDNSTPYRVRLNNGDILSGTIVRFVSDSVEGEGLRLRTAVGTAAVYTSQIAEIVALEAAYRHSHRLFLMPAADPIGRNHFAGLFELAFLYAGFGIGPASVTLGRSVIPGLTANEQLSTVNAKITVARVPNETMPGGFAAAAGVNIAWANDRNQILHPYIAATFTLTRTRVTGSLFFKTGAAGDFFTVSAARYGEAAVRYPNGSIGLAIGLDTRFSERHDLHFVGEFWNADLTSPRKSAAFLGLRLCNSAVSADFGVAVFAVPVLAPYFGFAWTPF